MGTREGLCGHDSSCCDTHPDTPLRKGKAGKERLGTLWRPCPYPPSTQVSRGWWRENNVRHGAGLGDLVHVPRLGSAMEKMAGERWRYSALSHCPCSPFVSFVSTKCEAGKRNMHKRLIVQLFAPRYCRGGSAKMIHNGDMDGAGRRKG
jgi:hypothetical protein